MSAKIPVGYAYLGDGVGITYTHRGHRIYVYTRDRGLSPWLILNGTWEGEIEETVRRNLSPGDTVIECGCNMGYHTLHMADRVGPTGKVYGFEANPAVFTLLNDTIDLNGYLPFTKLFNHAVGDTNRAVRFQFTPRGVGGANVVVGNADQTNVFPMMMETLDTTLPDVANVRVLRMDVEGSEPLIIKGAKNIIDRSPHLMIVCEWNIGMMRARVDVGEYANFLQEMGFRPWRIVDALHCEPITFDSLLTGAHDDVVFARNDEDVR